MVDWEAFWEYDRLQALTAQAARTAANTLVARLAGMSEEQLAVMHEAMEAGGGFGLGSPSIPRPIADVAGSMPDDLLEEALKRILPELVDRYGGEAARQAIDFYRKQRRFHGIDDGYVPDYTADIPQEFVTSDVGEALATSRDDPAALARNLGARVGKTVAQAGERTMITNAKRDPAHPRWAFVPRIGACPWCMMVGSNGWHYHSEETAKAQRHTNCFCPVVVDFDTKNPALRGYDPDGMRARLKACGKTCGSDAWEDVLKEANLYDREYLRTGTIPKVSYDSDDTEEKKARDPQHPSEVRTARILAQYGFKVTFHEDEIQVDGGRFTRGRADLASGVEIKTLDGASTQSTFDARVRNTKGKQGVTRLVVDVSKNKNVSDEEAISLLADALRRKHYPEAILINHAGELVRVLPRQSEEK